MRVSPPMKTDAELKQENPELYRIAREGGTERPGSSELLSVDTEGVFRCAVCDAALFPSTTKFDSGSGWPSFTDPVNAQAVLLTDDTRHGVHRTEVRCATCKAHLGHVFPDGPATVARERRGPASPDRHDRYCINGISLRLEKT